MQLDDTATILANAEFFDICDTEQKRLLAFASERREHGRGAVLVKAGDVPEGGHLLVRGRLAVEPLAGDGSPFEVKTPGALIGAMALIVARPRPLTVTATIPSETLFVPRSAFMKLARQYPDLAARAAARIADGLADYLEPITAMRDRFTPPA